MYIRKIAALAIAAALLTTTISCSSDDMGTSNGFKSGNSKILSMYILNYDTTTKNAVEKFNTTHKDVQIAATSLAVTSDDELQSKLMFELNSGKGPDIILCERNTLPNLSVFFDKGSFYDLNTLIKSDKAFKQSKYVEKIMDYGIYKGSRYVIPLSFMIYAMNTTRDILDKAGIVFDEKDTGIDKFVDAANKYMKDNGAKGSFFISDQEFSSLVQTAEKPFFDLEKKTASFDTKEFVDLLDKYKTLSESICPAMLSALPSSKVNLLANGKVVFQSTHTMAPRYVAEPYGSFKTEVEPVIISAIAGDKASHVLARAERYIGINSKCVNVQAAYDFVKLMISKEFQDIDISEGIPVNREAYEKVKENCLKGMKGYDSWKKGGSKSDKTLKKLYSQIDKLIDVIDRCWTTDDYVLTIIQNETSNYLSSNLKKEDAVKNIQQKVEGYFKSGFMTEAYNVKEEDEAPENPLKTLSVYYWDNSQCYLANSEYLFSKKYPDVKVKKKTYNSFDSYSSAIAVEIMAGGGPDIVIFKPYYFKSIEKTVETGAFCEMDDYIKKLNVLNVNEYNKDLLDSGIYNGKRYYLPLYYFYSPIISTKQMLEKSNFKFDEGSWSWEKFAECSKDFMSKNKGKGKYFIDKSFSLMRMIRNSNIMLVDYKNRKSNFNSDSFKELLKLYKEIYPSINTYGDYYRNIIKDERVLLYTGGGMGEPSYFKIMYENTTEYNGGEMVVVPTPTLTGERKEYAEPSDCIAVNTRCKNKGVAFNFIKIAASYDMQRDYDSRGRVNGILALPVNGRAYKDEMMLYKSPSGLPKLLVDQMIKTHGIIEDCPIKDYSILEMADEMAKDYMEGKKTADQVAKELDDKVNVLLNE